MSWIFSWRDNNILEKQEKSQNPLLLMDTTQFAPLPVSAHQTSEWEGPGLASAASGSDFPQPFLGSQPVLPLFFMSCLVSPVDWSVCTPPPAAARRHHPPRRASERILCNLQLPWWLWRAQFPPIPHHLTPVTRSRNPGAVSRPRVMLWPARGHFVTQMRSGGKRSGQRSPINLFYCLAERLLRPAHAGN